MKCKAVINDVKCSDKFESKFMGHHWCDKEGHQDAVLKAAIANVRKKADKAFKQETVRRKKALKSRSDWLKEAQTAFNAFIRERDMDLPCISCGRFHDGQYHAGHYKSVGANPELRFNEDNCHKQCAPCNNHLSGNIANYRPNLILKIGQTALDSIEGENALQKLTIEQIKDIKSEYKKKLKELQDDG